MIRMIVTAIVSAWIISAPTAAWAAAPLYWSGTSGGFEVSWSSNDILARQLNGGQTVFSAQEIAKVLYAKFKPKGLDFTCEQDFKVLSLVGPILSMQYHYYSSQSLNGEPAEAHPAGGTIYFAVDLRKPGEVVKLIRSALGDEVSRPGEFHPQPLAEPCLIVSTHTAPITYNRCQVSCQTSNVRTSSDFSRQLL